MKPQVFFTLFGVAAWLGCVSGRAQGTINFTTRLLPDVDLQVFVTSPDSGLEWLPVSGPGWTAQLFGGPAGAPIQALAPLTPATTFRIGAGAGYVVPAGAVIVPGVPAGQPASLVLRVWDNTTGDSFHSALIQGQSMAFQSPPLGDPDAFPPIPPPNLGSAPSPLTGKFVIWVPEPSSILLGILGAGLLAAGRCGFWRERSRMNNRGKNKTAFEDIAPLR